MGNLSDKDYWRKEWLVEERSHYNFVSGELIGKYIPPYGTFLEVGCAPGSIMCYFNKVLGYRVSGIDYTSVDVVKAYLDGQGVCDYALYDGDFTTLEIKERFDVVGSFGFIEHFEDYHDIIERHKKLVNKDGYLVITLPNLRYFNWLILRILKPDLLKMHNLQTMNLARLRDAAADAFEVLYCDYFKSCFLFYDDQSAELGRFPGLKKIVITLKRFMDRLGLDNIRTRYFSPYIVLIAKRKPVAD